jgi:hypothetical protein
LLDHGAENVGHRFVQRAGLIVIGELRRELGDAMGQFMRDDVQRGGETLENHAVAVAINHLPAVPEGIVVFLTVMDRRDQCFPGIVHGLASKYPIVEVPGGAGMVEGFVHGLVPAGLRVGFRADEITWQIGEARAIEDLAP